MSILSERLRKCREEKKLTQAQVASVIGVSSDGYGHYETSRRTPSPEAIAKLADYFDTTTDYLLGRSDQRHRIVTVAAHTDDMEGLSPEAQEEVMQYIEFIKQKYEIGKKKK